MTSYLPDKMNESIVICLFGLFQETKMNEGRSGLPDGDVPSMESPAG
jgi:hypothetical protein